MMYQIILLVFLVVFPLSSAIVAVFPTPCSVTKEPFKLSYTRCTQVCVQTCNETNLAGGNCISLPNGCPNRTTTCGANGCECIPSKNLPGDPYSSQNISTAMTPIVECGPNFIKVRINKCAANERHFRLGDFYMNGISPTPINDPKPPLLADSNNTCKGTVFFSPGSLDYEFKIVGNLTACNGSASIDAGYKNITYTNAIQGVAGNATSVISRKRSMFMQFSCSYALNLNMTLGAPLTPTNRDVKIDSGIAEGKFVIDL
uniref:ZP domain-containing protein n=1 Tax=Ciona savignyi TaxID=51511 RepID=H2YH38_CIOSA